jgi:hypothetical protein
MPDTFDRTETKIRTNVLEKNRFAFQDFFQKLWTRETVQLPTNTNDIRDDEWKKYKQPYRKILTALNTVSTDSFTTCNIGTTQIELKSLNLSHLGHNLGVKNFSDKILVPLDCKIAMMCCVDERTQTGEFVDEMSLNGRAMGTISDPNVPRYVLDIPGSAALYCECEKTEKNKLGLDELEKIEEERLTKLAKKIVGWCKIRSIFKFTVTYHAHCGAVELRMRKFAELCSGNSIQVAKHCAWKTAQKIKSIAESENYEMEVTVAFIGDKQMCKIGPMEMHNAVGTLGCIDNRVLAHKFDTITGLNFFDTFIYSDTNHDKEILADTENIIRDAIRNINITLALATGDHGWGKEQFSASNPYLVLLFVNGEDQAIEAGEIFTATVAAHTAQELERIAFYLIHTDK